MVIVINLNNRFGCCLQLVVMVEEYVIFMMVQVVVGEGGRCDGGDGWQYALVAMVVWNDSGGGGGNNNSNSEYNYND